MPINRNVFITGLYLITAYLCLFLAVPPSFASAVWIPAGIALGATFVYGVRILPAIFIGAFLTNIYVDTHIAQHAFSSTTLLVSTFVGVGAALQAGITWFVITKWAKIDPSEYRIQHILLLAALAGPIGCLINTSFSNTAILLLGHAPDSGFLQSWLIWWVGDSIGALTITPMFLILLAKPREIWKPRIVPILLPMLICFLIAILLASFVRFFTETNQQLESYFVLMSGQLFCILMNIILSIIYGQKSLIQHEVTEKTAALQQAMLDLEKMAHFDSLTDIPNRRSFQKYLSSAIARSSRNHSLMAVCLLDLDDFKQINDSWGHQHGDALLQMIPRVLAPALRESDYIARLGGDEFGLILEDVHSAAQVSHIIERLVEKLNKPIEIFQKNLNISLSIGIALYPNVGTTPDELLKHADIAMYRAKRGGKSTYQFFNEELNRQTKRLHLLNLEMESALENGEFYLHYAPQFNIQSQCFSGAEALIRWKNPTLGEISPSEFIPVAEENNRICLIGEWAIKKACEDFKKIRVEGNSNLNLSLNISLKQLENDNFPDSMSQLSKQYNLKENPISLEITESALLKNPDQIIQTLHKLKPYGVQFTLDDFGTSYSSMLYLKSMPISAIKIGRDFIQNILTNKNDLEIVNATISLSKALGYTTIAEGVDTQEQFDFLTEAGCDIIQGHFLAHAGPIHELVERSEKFAYNQGTD